MKVDFFGHPALSTTGPAVLAFKFKVPVIPVYNYRDRSGRINIVFDEPYRIEQEAGKSHVLEEITKMWNRKFESYIRRYPDQWIWMHDRWKQ